jgi:hypothetical protein
MTKCAWCESAIEDGQSRVQLSDGTVYHMDPCRVLVLEREITQLRQQLALHTTGFDDGVYAGTREDWIARAQAAEAKVDGLKQQLATAEARAKITEFEVVPIAESGGGLRRYRLYGFRDDLRIELDTLYLNEPMKEAEIRAAFEAGHHVEPHKDGGYVFRGAWYNSLAEAFTAYQQSRQQEAPNG